MESNQTNLNTDQPIYTDEEEKNTLFNKINNDQNKSAAPLKFKTKEENIKKELNDDSLGMIDEKEKDQPAENKKSNF